MGGGRATACGNAETAGADQRDSLQNNAKVEKSIQF